MSCIAQKEEESEISLLMATEKLAGEGSEISMDSYRTDSGEESDSVKM